METTTGFFKTEAVDQDFEKSLAELVAELPVANRPEYIPTEEDKKQPKTLKIRKSMSVTDWDDCLK